MDKQLDYIYILKSLTEIPFGVGKKLLIDFLKGNEGNESITRNRLNKKPSFGSLAYDDNELGDMIESLIINNMIKLVSIQGNKFWKVMEITEKGKEEIKNPSLYKRKLAFNHKHIETEITEEDKIAFDALKDFLKNYNDEQKKAIISNKGHILCIAGAGSGKTTVLTKRVEFLIKYRGINPKNILAITFTRKARQEMMKRIPYLDVRIETFNSFCESILKENSEHIDSTRVISYKDKIHIINQSLESIGITIEKAIFEYFTYAQRRGKTDEELARIFMNDCFFIRDYFKFKNKPIDVSSFEIINETHEKAARIVLKICNYIGRYMQKNGLRDFADQIIDAIKLFEAHPETKPQFDYILVDEYQDVNSTQINLIDILEPKNLFAVGDPRQSIYGWRGSDIRYILNFDEKYPDAEIVTLTKNYRSNRHIVNLINSSIRNMGLKDLESHTEGEKDIRLIKFESESSEFEFLLQAITETSIPRSEIFILARTNRQLSEISNMMKVRSIKHIIRSDELRRTVKSEPDAVTLATIHAIKGLEARMVFVIGCNGANFPCRGSEHPVIEMVKVEEYDKEEEERRLFYVAMSRAKENLYMTFSGKSATNFISEEMMNIIGTKGEKKLKTEVKVKENFSAAKSNDIVRRLKEWRLSKSKELGIPAYIVMHDRTLFDISIKLPQTKEDLENIHGLGPAKIMKYGDELLNLM